MKVYKIIISYNKLEQSEEFHKEFNDYKSKVKLGSNMLQGQSRSSQQGQLGSNNYERNEINQKYALPDKKGKDLLKRK